MIATAAEITRVEPDLDSIAKIKAHLKMLACSDAWVESIWGAIRENRIRTKTDDRGRVTTKMSKVIEAVMNARGDVDVYPPRADSPGSSMRPCLSRACTRHPQEDGHVEDRSIMYPPQYAPVNCCYACRLNRTPPDELAESLGLDPSTHVSPSAEGFKQLENRREWNPDAWRGISYRDMGFIDAVILNSLAAFTWSTVEGKKKAFLRRRGLKNLGQLWDYLELGRRLTDVPGITAEAAAIVAEIVQRHPREGESRAVYVKEARVKQRRWKKLPERRHDLAYAGVFPKVRG